MGYLDATNYGSYNQKTSAANSTNSTSTGNKRLTKVLNGKTYTELDLIEAGLKGGFTNRNIALLLALDADKAQEKPNSNDVVTTAKNNWTASPKDYKFNLPPHQWSIPLRPVEVDSTIVSGANGSGTSFHGLRRGRIWYWNTSGDITQIDSSTGETVTAAEKVAGTKVVGGSEINLEDRKYAFQFLWNPESISVNVARNMDITPSAADALRVVTGVKPIPKRTKARLCYRNGCFTATRNSL